MERFVKVICNLGGILSGLQQENERINALYNREREDMETALNIIITLQSKVYDLERRLS